MTRVSCAMTNLFLAVLLLGVYACNNAPADGPAVVTVTEAATLLASGAIACDANNDDVRGEFGVIPGAIRLSSYTEYATSELPTDKTTQLIFYCSNELCSAGSKAALKASNDGYDSVFVLAAGIKGWVEGKQPTDES